MRDLEPIVNPNPKKYSYRHTRDRIINRRYMAYEALKTTVQKMKIPNRWQYEKWVRKEQPIGVPLYPWRVYKEWVKWGDFLGTDSEFVPFMQWKEARKKTWRPYYDAARWVQQQGYKTANEFLEAHKAGEIPADIPRSPAQVEAYKEYWNGWKSFLGKKLHHQVEVQQKVVKLFAITTIPGYAQNYLQLILAPEGLNQLKPKIETNAFRVYDYENEDLVLQIMNANGSNQGGNVYIVPNVNQLFSMCDEYFTNQTNLIQS